MGVGYAVMCSRHKEALEIDKFGRRAFTGREIAPSVREFRLEMMDERPERFDPASFDRVKRLVSAFVARHPSCPLSMGDDRNGDYWPWGEGSQSPSYPPMEGGRIHPSGWKVFWFFLDAEVVRQLYADNPHLVERELASGKVDLEEILGRNRPL
jgi:hypothetical protein